MIAEGPGPAVGRRFHHIGVACERIEDEWHRWLDLGYVAEGEAFVDADQGVRGRFMTGGGPRIELLEATEGSTTLKAWLKRGVKWYHFGYVVDDFDAALAQEIADGAVVTREPRRSTYFGRRIAFVMRSNMALIELIETPLGMEEAP